jgi:hypothetical protein
MNKKEKLIKALKEEFNSLKDHPNFDETKQAREYNLAIKYLETGEHPFYYNDNDLLYGCIEDFEQMCSDYDV